MYNGILVLCPKILVDQSTLVTSRRIRGRNHTLYDTLVEAYIDHTC